MRNWVPIVLASLVAWGGIVSAAAAQQMPAVGVALIDIGYIYKHHEGFKAQVAELEKAVNLADIDFKSRAERLKQQAGQLREMAPGSPEHKSLETALFREQQELNTQLTLQRKQFADREAAIYYSVYKEIQDEVAFFCQRNRIALVFRFNGEPLDTSNSATVLQQINRDVVYYDKPLDITPIILDQLNRKRAAAIKGPIPR
jgi:Skp family chaperone for outer membrane proteins